MAKSVKSAKSFGEACAKRIPIVMRYKDDARIPEVMFKKGDEVAALELLEKMNIVKRVYMPD